MKKIFIIGLPRTGTTSISVALLNYGLKVAHT
ncbi:MAG: sulfotransferase family protein, partial [Sphingobacteriales bacterium]